MKVKIYVQNDGTALVVPIAGVNNPLPPHAQTMKNSAVSEKEADLDDSIIGMDRGGAQKGIQTNGHYVNKPKIQITEHSIKGDIV